jgi:nucleotide-binding universal stress UspA family protein
MYRTILVALDGSENAEKVLPYLEPALRIPGHRAVLVQVLPEGEPSPIAASEAYLKSVARRLSERKMKADWSILRGDAALALIRFAQERAADLLAFTSHGQGGMAQWVFGSVAQKILRGSARPLLVVRALQSPIRKIRRILVPVDGSSGSEVALPHALFWAAAFQATVQLQYVAPEPGLEADNSKMRGWLNKERRRMEDRFGEIERSARELRFLPVIDEGDPATRIVERAEASPAPLVVMGSHGRSGLSRWMYGSVSEKVLQAATVPVLVARRPT